MHPWGQGNNEYIKLSLFFSYYLVLENESRTIHFYNCFIVQISCINLKIMSYRINSGNLLQSTKIYVIYLTNTMNWHLFAKKHFSIHEKLLAIRTSINLSKFLARILYLHSASSICISPECPAYLGHKNQGILNQRVCFQFSLYVPFTWHPCQYNQFRCSKWT